MGSKFSKNVPQKQKKREYAPKRPILGMFLCMRVTKCVSPEFAVAVKLYLAHFLQMKMVGKLKNRGIG